MNLKRARLNYRLQIRINTQQNASLKGKFPLGQADFLEERYM